MIIVGESLHRPRLTVLNVNRFYTDMARPNADIDVEVDDIDAWYFFPYTSAPAYASDNPLYAVVAVFEDFGDVVVFDRPGEGGVFHSTDPNNVTEDPYPPTDEFKTALATILSQPGETHDISNFLEEMEPWEHHFLETIVQVANSEPEHLPVEVRSFINTVLDEKLRMKIDDEADETWFSKFTGEEQETFLESQ